MLTCCFQLPDDAKGLEKELKQIVKKKSDAVRSQEFEKVFCYIAVDELLSILDLNAQNIHLNKKQTKTCPAMDKPYKVYVHKLVS